MQAATSCPASHGHKLHSSQAYNTCVLAVDLWVYYCVTEYWNWLLVSKSRSGMSIECGPLLCCCCVDSPSLPLWRCLLLGLSLASVED